MPRRPEERASSYRRGYDKTWWRIRARYLRAHPLCECDDCIALPEAQRPPATDVDHIDGSGPHGDNSETNLQAMAHGHHSSKTVKHDGGFGRRDPRRRPPEAHPGMIDQRAGVR